MLLSILSQITLARLLGVDQYGEYVYVFSWAILLCVPATLGLTTGSVRIIPQLSSDKKLAELGGFLKVAYFLPVLTAFIIALVFLYFINNFYDNGVILQAWLIGLLLIMPLNSLASVQGGILRGFKHATESQLSGVTESLVFIPLLFCAYLFYGESLSDSTALIVKAFALFTSVIICSYFLRRCYTDDLRAARVTYELRKWSRISVPLLLFSGMSVLLRRSDILMLGYFADNADVGIYAAISRISNLSALGIAAVNSVANPLIAGYFAQKNFTKLQKITTQSARIVFATTLCLSLLILVGWRYLLLAFGADFVFGRDSLFILMAGQVIVSIIGPIGQLLIMTKYEKLSAIMLLGMTITNIVFNALLIPIWGITGAAIATSAANLIWTFIFAFVIVRILPIRLSIFG